MKSFQNPKFHNAVFGVPTQIISLLMTCQIDNLGFLFSTNSITTKLWQQQKAKTTLVFKFMFISPGPRFGGDLLFRFRGYDARANAERFFTYLFSANDTSFYNLVEFKNPPAVNYVNCCEMYYTVHLRDVLLSSRI